MLIAWLAEFKDTTHLFWSGEGTLTFNSKTYEGAPFIRVSASQSSVGAPRRRLQVSFALTDRTTRLAFLQDPGPLTVEVTWIHSTDNGATWQLAPRKFVGRLSNPVISGGVYTIEIETYGGDVDRGVPLTWSDDDQQKRFPGDKGFEYLRQLASGIDTSWPH